MRRFATAFTVVMAGTAAIAGPARAQTIGFSAPVKPCYLTGDRVTIAGSGFTAGGLVTVAIDGVSLGELQADGAGGITGELRLGTMRGVKSHSIAATDVTNPAITASAAFMGTTHTVTVKPKNARAGRRLRLRGSGFLAAKPRVFMHVRGPGGYRSDGSIAKAKGACGTFAVRRQIVPTTAATGSYRVQFDQRRRFSKKTRPRVRGTMNVFPRAAGARASLFGAAALARRWTSLSG